jgi:uncharacterized RDD family membrane protein YckC
MNKQSLEELFEEGKARRASVARIWKPYKRVIWVTSTATGIYTFVKNAGDFTFPLLGLIALTGFLSFSPRLAPPIAGIQLLGRRTLALITDVLLISAVSFVSLFLLQSKDYLGPLLMLVVWATFLYIVFCDWRFNGTLGKQVWGLKVVSTRNTGISFCKSFIRAFLTFPLPIISGGLLRDILMGDGNSQLRFVLGEGFAEVAIYFIPMSIMFFGGGQSIADKIVGVSVQRKWQHIDANPSSTRPSTWALLVCSTFAWAFLLAALAYTGVGKIAITGLPKQPPAKNFQQVETITDPKTIAQLWAYLPMNLREPTSVIRKIELFAASPSPFTFRSKDSHTVPPLNPDEYLKQLNQVRFVRVSLAPYMFTVTKMRIVHNFLALGEWNKTTLRPSFALLQFGSDQKYGLFSISSQENILICWMGSDANPIDFPMELHPRYGIQPLFSLSEIYNLLLGNVAVIDYLLRE